MRASDGLASEAKRTTQACVRALHRIAFARALPDHVAIYFHDLQPVDYDAFAEMVDLFSSDGYVFVGPDEHASPHVERTIFVSFDDCYEGWYRALPFLRSLDKVLTFYVNTGVLRDMSSSVEIAEYFNRIAVTYPTRTLSSEELRALSDAGFVIGAHGHSHRCLSALPPDVAREDIRRSRDALETLVERHITHFSYPFGMRRHFNSDLREFSKNLGFDTIATGIPGMQYAHPSRYELHRSGWDLGRTAKDNLRSLGVDGRLFHRLTGRSAVG